MDVSDVKRLCVNFTDATLSEKGEPSNILSYKVRGKNFAYFKTSEPERWRFSIRVSPERFLELTDQPGVKPARYMHRFHWVTIVNVSAFDSAYLTELIGWSYRKACSTLSKKAQRELNV
ncbi:MmcQ/YjbR family DNA-binding protein [Zhongshania aquimaris]|uniref:MmcQ/YjbR family DNA-binding protein n=1 Tax=Zhongshania aquimaris TaxID=2857107 RepID=A0ABS6VWR4_9GAMM|nr:MmcQ/YjbR family DNA-binding protein [Zhongshania aquimaris]MBW2942778.1 MmcQ/YjbR family DNA-binding protein [Zhongshania aquimaris]